MSNEEVITTDIAGEAKEMYFENRDFLCQLAIDILEYNDGLYYSYSESGWRCVQTNDDYKEVELSEIGLVDRVDYLIHELGFSTIDASLPEGIWFLKLDQQIRCGLFYYREGEEGKSIGPGKKIHIESNWYYVEVGMT